MALIFINQQITNKNVILNTIVKFGQTEIRWSILPFFPNNTKLFIQNDYKINLNVL